MKKTPLYEAHLVSKAKMVDFAGWQLPILYSSIIEEHRATRSAAGIFDISHMGEIIVQGRQAEKFLRYLVPTSLDRLEDGKGMYTCLCNEYGGIIDDLFIFRKTEEEFYLVVNAATLEKDLTWLRDNEIAEVEIKDVSSQTAKIDLQGPQSLEIAKLIFPDDNLGKLKRFYFKEIDYQGASVMIACSGYTGELGYEFFLPSEKAMNLWNDLLQAGQPLGLRPVGLGARDSLRLEACLSLYGHELSDEFSPIEAGLGWFVNSKDPYIAHQILKQQQQDGTQVELVPLKLLEKGIPRENYQVQRAGVTLGTITSGSFSPTYNCGIALAYLTSKAVQIGDQVEILIRNKPVLAEVVKRPFYKYQGAV